MGKGTVWLIPATHENASIIELFASRMESVRRLAHSSEELSSALWEDIRRAVGLESPKKSQTAQELIMQSNKIKLFISHSSADADIAQKLIDLLRSGIPELPPAAIRCTSVPGYGLEGGADTNQEIFKELLEAEVLVALLSEQSLKSTYVLFELGARWGAKKHFFPLVVAGMGKSELNAPLNGRNAHSAAIETDLHQLVDEVAIKLGFEHPKPQVYTPQLKALVAASVKEGEQRNHAM